MCLSDAFPACLGQDILPLSLCPQYRLDLALEDASLEEHASAASKALHTDVSPQTDHLPLVAAAGVLLPQLHYVSELRLHGVTAGLRGIC